MNKKGLTPVIAVVLLLMMTVAAAGAAFFWFVRIQSEMQGGTESYSEQLSEKIASKADVSEIDVMNDESLKIIVRNIGNSEIPISNTEKVTWILKDHKQNIVCNQALNGSNTSTTNTYCQSGCETDIPVRSTRTLLLNISTTDHECFLGTYANNSVFYFKLDFAGVTGTGSQFVKDPVN
jgi:flagellin-like protein